MWNNLIIVLMLKFTIFLIFCIIQCSSDERSGKDEIRGVEDLISRILGSDQYLDSFDLTLDEQYPLYFEVYPSNGKIGITASSSIGLTSGFHYYFRYILQGTVTWETRNIPLDDFPVIPKEKVTKRRLGKYNYFFNVCTLGYTTTSWQFEEWERLIDWMALHGINLPLAFVGQEYIWYKTFETFGITLNDMLDYFTGPHFLPWNRMGNIQRWGGPVTEQWLIERFELQKKILERMRSLGMMPVLPGFGGFVPPAFVQKYPNVKVTKSTSWNNFNATYTGTYLLDSLDPMFSQIGKQFYSTLISNFGTDHFYNADTFNEMDPTNGTLPYLSAISKAVFDPMKESDESAVWVKQGWAFLDSREFWTNERIEAYLSSIPDESMLILDLYSEVYPFWKQCESYFQKPFIWSLLKNFGGHRAFFGDINHYASSPVEDLFNESSSMVGFGITSEAIYLPPMPFELFIDVYYVQDTPMTPNDVDSWLKQYLISRYGTWNTHIETAWENLRWGPWATAVGSIHYVSYLSVLEENPKFGIRAVTNSTVFDMTAVAFREIVKSGEIVTMNCTDGYLYDYVDIVRQFLSNLFVDIYYVVDYEYSESRNVTTYALELLEVLQMMDSLLLTSEHFLVGTWIESARKMGHSAEEMDLYECDARNQITLWGALNQGVGRDYARKQWNGLVGDYYYTRWKIFLDDVMKGSLYNVNKTQEKIEEFEVFWQTDFETVYPTTPSGISPLVLGEECLRKYGDEVRLELFDVVEGVDAPGNDIGKTVTTDPITLAFLCSLEPSCQGFNSNGWIKYDVGTTTPYEGVNLYVKKK